MMSTRRYSQWLLGGLVATACVASGVMLREYLRPIPRKFVGTWENTHDLIDAGPGEIRLMIRPDGHASLYYDRDKYFWWADEWELRGRASSITIRSLPDGKPVECEFQVSATHLTIVFPGNDSAPLALRFRRIASP